MPRYIAASILESPRRGIGLDCDGESALPCCGQGAERLHEELVPITARWIEPSQRKGPLAAYARDAEARTLELLERSLGDRGRAMPGEAIQRQLLDAAQRDIEELLPQVAGPI